MAGLLLAGLGTIVTFVGWVLFLVAAFREGIIWGLLCLFISPVCLVFLVVHWGEAWKPFAIQLVGAGLVAVGCAFQTGALDSQALLPIVQALRMV